MLQLLQKMEPGHRERCFRDHGQFAYAEYFDPNEPDNYRFYCNDCGTRENIMRQEHYDKYESIAQHIGIAALLRLMPVSRERVASALVAGERHLNSIVLKAWDRRHAAVVALCQQVRWQNHPYVMGENRRFNWSLSDSVCVLKHVAAHHYLKD